MLPKSLRLSRQGFASFKRLSRSNTSHFSISYGASPLSAGSAVIVPKKVVKTSVGRHQLKRRVREALREWSSKDHILIVSARPGAELLTSAQIKDELSEALSVILAK